MKKPVIRRKRWTDETRAKALQLAKDGKKNHEIAPLVGMSVAAVQHLTWGSRDRKRPSDDPPPERAKPKIPAKPRTPYTRDTLQRMRDLTAQGRTSSDIAAEFNWSHEELLRCAGHHEITLIRTTARTATVDSVEALRPEIKLTKGGKPRRQLLDHPRCCYFTVAISEKGRERLLELAASRQKPIAGVAAIMLDYALRSGAVDGLMRDAFRELETA